MAFTLITVTDLQENPDGSTPSGVFSATPVEAMANGTETIDAVTVPGQYVGGALVNMSGLPFVIAATDDTGTTPTGNAYVFTRQMTGGPLEEFTAVVPHASTTVTLQALRASAGLA